MIAVALVSESRIDFGAFMQSAQSVTGMNHVVDADAHPGPTQLATDLKVLRDFASKEVDLAMAITYVGFLVAGMPHDLSEIIEYTRGMPHLSTGKSLRADVGCIMIVGNLDQWKKAVIEGCRAHPLSTARAAFNQVYMQLCQKGLSDMFNNMRTQDKPDGTFLLLEHK